MNYGIIDDLKDLDEETLWFGLRRLGVAIRMSLDMQKLTVRDVEELSTKFYDHPLSKDTVSKLCSAKTNPTLSSLNRIAPFCFQVMYFDVDDRNNIGVPMFVREVNYTSKPKVDYVIDLPDLDIRYDGAHLLCKIIKGEIQLVNSEKALAKNMRARLLGVE